MTHETGQNTRVNGATASTRPEGKTYLCNQCRKPYKPTKAEQRFCKTACRSAFWNAKKASVEDTALLLAAAPDLLAALRHTASLYKEIIQTFGQAIERGADRVDVSDLRTLFKSALPAVEAAILKAEGPR